VARLWGEMKRRGSYNVVDRPSTASSGQHSDAVVVADADWNIAALCHSSNTTAWGTTGLFVDGVSVPDSACFQQAEIERAGPGSRLPDPMNPVIVTRGDQPVLAASCVGESVHEVMVQKLYGVLALGQDATQRQ
jgi:gamma-glutamyltranspeptidase/glutathione hydrolase